MSEANLNGRDDFVTGASVACLWEMAKDVVGGICTMQSAYMDEGREG